MGRERRKRRVHFPGFRSIATQTPYTPSSNSTTLKSNKSVVSSNISYSSPQACHGGQTLWQAQTLDGTGWRPRAIELLDVALSSMSRTRGRPRTRSSRHRRRRRLDERHVMRRAGRVAQARARARDARAKSRGREAAVVGRHPRPSPKNQLASPTFCGGMAAAAGGSGGVRLKSPTEGNGHCARPVTGKKPSRPSAQPAVR